MWSALSDILGTENDIVSQHIEEEVNRKLLYSAMSKLEPRERELMEMRFGLKSGREMSPHRGYSFVHHH